eukprot:3666556-Pleurochrysis_carterae.AAC.3
MRAAPHLGPTQGSTLLASRKRCSTLRFFARGTCGRVPVRMFEHVPLQNVRGPVRIRAHARARARMNLRTRPFALCGRGQVSLDATAHDSAGDEAVRAERRADTRVARRVHPPLATDHVRRRLHRHRRGPCLRGPGG